MEKKSKIILISVAAVLFAIVLALLVLSRGSSSGSDLENPVNFQVEVTHRDKSTKTFSFTTSRSSVGRALSEQGLISGDSSSTGLYVKVVDGERADYALDGDYWAFYIDGVAALQGVDSTPVEEGSVYAFKVE